MRTLPCTGSPLDSGLKYYTMRRAPSNCKGPAGLVPASLVAASILLGLVAIAVLNEVIPHGHFLSQREGPRLTSLRRIWLLVIAITIHNFPEGVAVGVGFGTGDYANGISRAIGIALQNLPERLAVAVALTGEGCAAGRAVWIAFLAGLVEPVGGLLGAAAVSIPALALP